MAQRTYEKKNYVFLYRGLAIVRDALLNFVVTCLKEAYQDEWWEKGVAPAFRPEDLEHLKSQFDKRYSSPAGPTRPGSELYEILDINYLVMLVENKNNWKHAFAGRLNNDRTLLSYIREVILYRNPVAHPETGDLKDDDAFRGLDSGERLLRLIDQDAANEIVKIKGEFRNSWIFEEVRLRNLTPEEVGIDVGKGLEALDHALEARDGRTSRRYNNFSTLKMSLLANLDAEKKSGFSAELGRERMQMIERLNELSNEALDKSFTDACIVISQPKLTHEQAAEKVHNLKKYIKRLETELRNLELDLTFQEQNHAISEWTTRKILQTREKLEEHRQEYETLWSEVSPEAYFSVSRSTEPRKAVEENPVTVKVTLQNLGRKATHVEYSEGMGPGIVLLGGQTTLSQEVQPQETVSFQYQVYCKSPGKHSLHTLRLEYIEKVQGWDDVADTEIACAAGVPPHLTGRRYYQYFKDGIELIVQLRNEGTTIAHQVEIDQQVPVHNGQPGRLHFTGDLFPQQEQPVTEQLAVAQARNIDFPPSTVVHYADQHGNKYELRLEEEFSLLEYTYPTLVEISGRQQELKTAEGILRETAGERPTSMPMSKSRTVLVEGEEGVGKTRFMEEVIRRAGALGFKCICVDATDRIPVQQILRQLLGLSGNEASREALLAALDEALPGSQDSLQQWPLLIKYLASQTEETYDISRLNAGIVDLVNHLSRKSPLLLVFENVHRTPEGLETRLFQYLIKGINLSGESRLVIFATFRPRGQALPKCFTGIDIPSYGFTRLALVALDQMSAEEYADRLIPFPRLSGELKEVIFEWSKNNPLYLKEFLRHIMNLEKGLVQRLGNFWYPTPELVLEDLPRTLNDIILRRVKEELSENLDLLQILSVIGLESPWSLIMKVLTAEFPDCKEEELESRIWDLEKARMLNIHRKVGAGQDELVVEFEHQAKRESIYEDTQDFPETRKRRIRDLIVRVLDEQKNGFFPDEEEQIRQVARHVLKSSRNTQFEKREYLRKAASIEEKRQNFIRCLEYYDSYLSAIEGHDFDFEKSQTQYSIGKIYKLQGKWKEGAQYLDLALDNLARARKAGHSKADLNRLHGRILAERGGVLIKQKRYEEADKILYQARKNYEGVLGQWRYFPPRTRAYFYEDLVEIYLNLAEAWSIKLDASNSNMLVKMETSKKAIGQAEEYARRYRDNFHDISLLVKVCVSSGEMYNHRRNLPLATQWLEQALELIESGSRENASMHFHERALSLLAEIYRGKGQNEKARSCFLKAQAWQEQVQDIVGLGITYAGMGELYLEEKNYADALFNLELAYKKQKLVGDTDRIWKTCFSLFKANLQEQEYEKAGTYWQTVRMTLPERFKELPLDEQAGVFGTVKALADKQRKENNLEDAIRYYLDARVFARTEAQITQVDLALGEIYRERRDVDAGISVMHDALDNTADPLEQADLYTMLGDFCNLSRDHSVRQSAHEHYEKSIEIYVKQKLNKDAFLAYQKYLQVIEDDREEVYDLSVTLNNFIELMLNSTGKVDMRFVEYANSLFIKKQNYRAAGHALANTVAKISNRGFEDERYDELCAYLARAEEIYMMSKDHGVWIEGLNKLISIYFTLNNWDRIVDCYKKLLAICADQEDPQEFLDTFRSVLMLQDKLDNIYLKELVNVVTRSKNRLKFSSKQSKSLNIHVAKCFHHIADHSKDPKESETYRTLALEQYEIPLRGMRSRGYQGELPDEDYNMIEVALNDSALILHDMHRDTEAVDRLNRSISMAINEKNRFGEACSRSNLGRLLIELRDFKGAEGQYEEAIKIFLGHKAYWEERTENQATAPLTSQEVARLHYERNYIASVSESYGYFIFGRDAAKGQFLLQTALELYQKQGDTRAAERVQSAVQQLALIMPINGLQAASLPFPGMVPFDEFTSCGACGHRYKKSLIDCPQCGSRNCPNCQQLCQDTDEFCPACDTYLGPRSLRYFGGQ